jgi:hypothetical protein
MAAQILIRAELEMRLYNGVRKEKKITYSHFNRRVPHSEKISKKDSLVNSLQSISIPGVLPQ